MKSPVALYLSPGEWFATWNGGAKTAGEAMENSGPEALWTAALAGLSEHLPGGARIGVVVSSEACHFLSLPWSSDLMDQETGSSYARNAFVATFGNVAAGWQLAVGDGAFGRRRLACGALPEWFGGTLKGGASWRIEWARPSIERAFARFRQHLKEESGALAFPDGNGVGLARWEAGDIVEARHLDGVDPFVSLESWQARSELETGHRFKLYWIAPGAEPLPETWVRVTDTSLPVTMDSAAARIAFWSL